MYKLDKEKRIYTDSELGIEAHITNEFDIDIVETPNLSPILESEVRERIAKPACGCSIPDIIREKGIGTVAILVSDATRGVPNRLLLDCVIKELEKAEVPLSEITVFVAIGVHRCATATEMKDFLGDYYEKVNIENHNPYDEASLITIGTTQLGTPIKVNKKAYESHIHIQIGKVEPHEFAGFSGGRKSVLPGVSSEDTIIVNHRPDMILNSKATIGVLDENPVSDDMIQAAEMFRMDFGVNCVLNNTMEIAGVFAGEMEKSHEAAVDFVKEHIGVKLNLPDIIVTTAGKPLDIDFYQTMKCLIALTGIAEKDTKIIVYCGCPEGIASADMMSAFSSSDDIHGCVKFAKENYKIQMDHVLLVSKVIAKGVEIFAVCENISDDDFERMFMKPQGNLEKAIEEAVRATGKDKGKILFYPRPQTGLPIKV